MEKTSPIIVVIKAREKAEANRAGSAGAVSSSVVKALSIPIIVPINPNTRASCNHAPSLAMKVMPWLGSFAIIS